MPGRPCENVIMGVKQSDEIITGISINTRPKGNGMGLATTYRIIKTMVVILLLIRKSVRTSTLL